jgi:hypothetical protein
MTAQQEQLLFDAIEQDCATTVQQLLEQERRLVHCTNSSQNTPLYEACVKGSYAIVKMLIEHEADVNATDKFLDTPLHAACINDYLSIATLLIDHGANTNAIDRYHDTPLHLACSNEAPDVALLLLNNGASLHATNVCADTTPANGDTRVNGRADWHTMHTHTHTHTHTLPADLWPHTDRNRQHHRTGAPYYATRNGASSPSAALATAPTPPRNGQRARCHRERVVDPKCSASTIVHVAIAPERADVRDLFVLANAIAACILYVWSHSRLSSSC